MLDKILEMKSAKETELAKLKAQSFSDEIEQKVAEYRAELETNFREENLARVREKEIEIDTITDIINDLKPAENAEITNE